MTFGCEVIGTGHLAETLSRVLDIHGISASRDLIFVAEDILDHEDGAQLATVEAAFTQALDARAVCGGVSTSVAPIVILSQVPPGWIRAHLEAGLGAYTNVYYQVDTIIMRRAVERMYRPEQFIIGCLDPSADLPLAYQAYLAACGPCPVLQMSYESAELAKCAINYFLASQVRIANELYDAARACGGAYADVSRALAGDARIGPHAYLRPGEINQHLRRDVDTIGRLVEGAGSVVHEASWGRW